jgi:hypothetical protein
MHHNACGHAAISRQDKAISLYIRKSNTLKIFHRTSKLSLFFSFVAHILFFADETAGVGRSNLQNYC